MKAMIDIETMGTQYNAAIVQIGACVFDRDYRAGVPLLVDVSPYDCLANGASIDQSTVDWWAKQGGFAPVHTQRRIEFALCTLSAYLNRHGVTEIWCQGPHFDVTILTWHYQRHGIPVPWEHWQVRDCRTVRQLAKQHGHKVVDERPTHRADEDCVAQVKALASAMEYLLND